MATTAATMNNYDVDDDDDDVVDDDDDAHDDDVHAHLNMKEPLSIRRLLICTGQIYYHLSHARKTRKIKDPLPATDADYVTHLCKSKSCCTREETSQSRLHLVQAVGVPALWRKARAVVYRILR
eukprot:6460008-Amphidinium_carterae.1